MRTEGKQIWYMTSGRETHPEATPGGVGSDRRYSTRPCNRPRRPFV